MKEPFVTSSSQSKVCKNCGMSFRNDADFLNSSSAWRICNEGNLWFDCRCHSTMMLPKGKFPWYDPSMAMGENAKSLFNRLAQLKTLPHIPAQVMKLQCLCDDESIDTAEIARDVKRDPVIGDEVFRIALHLRNQRNPSNKGFESIEHAIQYIGRKTLKQLLVSTGLQHFQLRTKRFSQKDFWREALTVAAIAEYFARSRNLNLNYDELFIAGSLVNIGKIAGAYCLPDEIDKIVDQYSDPKLAKPWRQLEVKLQCSPHVVLGEIAACLWGFSKYLIEAINSHHDLAKLADSQTRSQPMLFFTVISYANQIAHWALLEPEKIEGSTLKLSEQHLGLTRKESEELAKDLPKIIGLQSLIVA